MASDAKLRRVFGLLTGRLDDDGKPLGPRREETRRRIVEATTAQLLEHGYRGMRVDDVASSASVTRPTLYSYFASKELMLIAAMSEEAMLQLEHVAVLFDPTRPAEERLRDWAREAILYIEKAPLTARMARERDPEVMRILTEHELAKKALELKPDLSKARLFAALVREAFPDSFTDLEAREIASLLRALSHMAPTLLDEHARFGLPVERMADLLARLLIDGMQARGRGTR